MWQVEIDPVCRSVLARHFMDMGLQRGVDVRDVKTADFVRPDVICGGFPCQDISVAGKRAGLAGERSGLWFEFRRIIAEFAPRWVCIENVAGLLSSNEGRDLGTILGQLGELGYVWAYRVFDSQYHGVAQRRRRVFIVGYLGAGSAGLPARVLFEPESVFWDSPPCRETGTRTSEIVAGCLNSGGNNGGFRTEPGEHLVAFGENNTGGPIDLSTACNAHGGRQDFESETFVAYAIQERSVSENPNNGPQGKGWQEGLAFTLEARHHQQAVAYQCHGSNVGPMGTLLGNGSVSGGVPFVEIADTLTSSWHRSNGAKAGNNSGIINPIRCGKVVRRLTPREYERLQSFPDDWTRWGHDGKEISNSARYRMLGNAVTVNVAEWIGRRIMEEKSRETK